MVSGWSIHFLLSVQLKRPQLGNSLFKLASLQFCLFCNVEIASVSQLFGKLKQMICLVLKTSSCQLKL